MTNRKRTQYLSERDGRYQSRVVVPRELRAIVGKSELLTPLGGDLRAAKEALPRAVADAKDQIAAAWKVFRGEAAQQPATPTMRRVGVAKLAPSFNVAAMLKLGGGDLLVAQRVIEAEMLRRMRTSEIGEPGTMWTTEPLATSAPISLTALFEEFASARKAAGQRDATSDNWRRAIKNLVELAGDDAAKITRQDLHRWRDESLRTIAASTFVNVRLAAARATFAWAIENSKFKGENPAVGVKVRAPRKMQVRDRGFTDAETQVILRAALADKRPAFRWVPWIMALTGCRVGEAMQLRRQDIHRVDGIDFIRITPEAGTVKTGQFRDVPIHNQLIDQGFLEFVAASKSDVLFYRESKTEDRLRTIDRSAKRIGVWVRSLGVDDKDISPSHAWRHRFKTVGHAAGIDARTLDAIQGHAPATVGAAYGTVTLATKKAAIDRLPWIDVLDGGALLQT